MLNFISQIVKLIFRESNIWFDDLVWFTQLKNISILFKNPIQKNYFLFLYFLMKMKKIKKTKEKDILL